MTHLVKQLETIENFEQLKLEVLNLVDKHDISQIMCQGTADDPDNWLAGSGRVDRAHVNEREFCFINSAIRGSVLDYYIQKYKAYRTRIMIMPPRHCYSVHPDPTPRIHIPIVTNNQAWMVWPYNNQCYQLATGISYWTDTRKYHTFINGENVKRIHIVMCVDN